MEKRFIVTVRDTEGTIYLNTASYALRHPDLLTEALTNALEEVLDIEEWLYQPCPPAHYSRKDSY